MARKTSRKTTSRKSTASAIDAKAPAALSPLFVRDEAVLDGIAKDAQQRRAVLVSALANDWADTDIGTIERIDQGKTHGWEMWPLA